mmetsp:Transcript_12874/g.17554  ORF Transcript_12874/g.17554 Transcript_12874/m.17554 type:complete len:165 (+) Transcript_12874:168-662(+)
MDVLFLNRILPTDFILVVWDSDASDVDESELSEDEVLNLRHNFAINLKDVIYMLQKYTSYIAIGGPVILGEGESCPHRLKKLETIEYYKAVTQNITLSNGIDYMDLRKAFLSAIPNTWQSCEGLLTSDGEHPNEKGTQLEASILAEQINKWFKFKDRSISPIHR